MKDETQGFEARLVPTTDVADLAGPGGGLRVQGAQKVAERWPLGLGGAGWREGVEGLQIEAASLEPFPGVPGPRRANPGQKLQAAKGGDGVARILRPAQDAEDILDMRSFEETEATVLDEGDVPARELDFQRVAVVGGAEEHGLPLEGEPGFALREHALGHVAHLLGLVVDGDEQRTAALLARGKEILGEASLGEANGGVGGVEDGLARPVVLLQRDDRGGGGILRGKIEDVAHAGGAEGVDGLGVVADDRDAAAVGLQPEQDLRLQLVGVLVLVDQHVVEALADLGRKPRFGHHHPPVEQEVVVVEDVARPLGVDVGGEKLAKLRFPFHVPGERLLQAVTEWFLGIDHTRIDGQASGLARETLLGLRQTKLVAEPIEQVGRVLAVEHGERRIETNGRSVQAQEPVGDGMEGAGPGQAAGCAVPRPRLAEEQLRPADHLRRRPACEGQEQHPPGIRPSDDQLSDPMGEGSGLSRAGSRDDEERPVAVFHGRALGGVELIDLLVQGYPTLIKCSA